MNMTAVNIMAFVGKVGLTALLVLIYWWLGWFIASLTDLSWAESVILPTVAWWLWKTGHSA